ncbi:hypothetical protein [Bacillus sp. FSL K6-3431]|uniref:hypothetical protein n=1 Tax=Bacillus sp. FSL K6-3431 TaxID=2921500 RepID=UPI0030FA63FD
MESWRQALWLVKFELRAYRKNMFFAMLPSLLLYFAIVYTLESDKVNDGSISMLDDILFVTIFWFAVVWMKPKEFQYQKLAGKFWASPYFVMLKQLPIPKDILIKSRFLQYYVTSIPVHLLVLMMIFISSPTIRDLLSPGEYIAFSLIWLSSGMVMGGVFPASESGEYNSKLKLVIYTIISIVVFLGGFIALYIFTGEGLVYWSIVAANKWPILSASFSICIAVAFMIYWPHYMRKNIERIDYFK